MEVTSRHVDRKLQGLGRPELRAGVRARQLPAPGGRSVDGSCDPARPHLARHQRWRERARQTEGGQRLGGAMTVTLIWVGFACRW